MAQSLPTPTHAAIGQVFGITRERVRQVLMEMGYSKPKVWWVPPPLPRQLDWDKVVELARAGMYAVEIARRLGYKKSSVQRILARTATSHSDGRHYSNLRYPQLWDRDYIIATRQKLIYMVIAEVGCCKASLCKARARYCLPIQAHRCLNLCKPKDKT